MTPYTRPQLIVLLVVALVAGIGLGVGHWRRAHPDLEARLERIDRSPAPFSPSIGDLPPATPPRRRSQRSTVPAPTSGRQAVSLRPGPVGPIDINRATVEELRALPGIGAVLAARIVEARERDGAFASLDDLARVRGLTRSRVTRLSEVATAAP